MMLLLCTLAQAQNNRGDRVQKAKEQFISERLDLTEKESNAFWSIYHSYKKDIQGLRKDFRPNSSANLESEQAAISFLENRVSMERKKVDLREAFIYDLLDHIPATKLVKLKQAEEDFKKKLLQRRNRKRGNR